MAWAQLARFRGVGITRLTNTLTRMLIKLSPLLLMAFLGATPLAVAENTVGLAVGQKAPAFILKDQKGKDVGLETLLKKGPVALVFHRSADW